MNFIQIRAALAPLQIFSISDIRSIIPAFDRRRLSEWQEKGYIRKVIKGTYIFSDVELEERRLYEIANKIYRPSYISFETALAHYQLIPESVYTVTSASTRRTYEFETSLTRFSFRTIHRKLFFGYSIEPGPVKIASMEKAVLDYFYLNTFLRTEDDFASLRIDGEAFLGRLDQERLFLYLDRFDQQALAKRMRHFMKWIRHA